MERMGNGADSRIDMLSHFDRADVWGVIDTNNELLNAPTAEKEGSQSEKAALDMVRGAIGSSYLRGRTVTATGMGRARGQDDLEPMSVRGRYKTLVSMRESGSGKGRVAMRITVGRGERSREYLMSLDRDALVQFDFEEKSPGAWMGEADASQPTVDLMSEYFGDDFQRIAKEIASRLEYASVLSDDSEDYDRKYDEAMVDLELAMPPDHYLEKMIFSGYVFSEDAQMFEHYAGEVVNGAPEIVEIEDEMVPTIAVQLLAEGEGRVTTFYIVPDERHVSKLESLSIKKPEKTADPVDLLYDEVLRTRGAIDDPNFYSLSHEQQRERLGVYSTNVEDHLAALTELYGGTALTYMVKSYRSRAAEMTDLDFGWGHLPVVSHPRHSGGFQAIQPDSVSAYNPDIDNEARMDPVRSPHEFLLSGGEPMLLMIDEKNSTHYLVRVSDIVQLSSVYEPEE